MSPKIRACQRAILASMFVALLPTCSAQVRARLAFPNPDPGGPVYARVERPFQLHNNQDAAILFYRDPSCIPEAFNLLDLEDRESFPGPNARAFKCPMTVDGFQWWTTYPIPGPPNQVFTRGTGAVPVWFVSWSDLQGAVADNKLTIVELRSMPSLQIGHAIHFEETLRLSPMAQTLAIRGTATGDMLDGRPFEFQFALDNGRVTDLRIKLDKSPK